MKVIVKLKNGEVQVFNEFEDISFQNNPGDLIQITFAIWDIENEQYNYEIKYIDKCHVKKIEITDF